MSKNKFEDEENMLKFSLENVDLFVYTGSILGCKVDAIVNSVDTSLSFQNKVGLVKAIYEKFGSNIEIETKKMASFLYKNIDLLEKCILVKSGSKSPKYILNSVTPVYSRLEESKRFGQKLFNTFINILKTANNQKDIHCLALPLLASGFYGAPKELCSKILLDSIQYFYSQSGHAQINVKEIHLVNIDKEATKHISKEINQIFNKQNNQNKEKLDLNHANHNNESEEKKKEAFNFKRIQVEKENSKSSCDLCKQRIKTKYLNYFKDCQHKFCYGCSILIKENKSLCLLENEHINDGKNITDEIENVESNENLLLDTFKTNGECRICCDYSNDLIYLYKCKHEMCLVCYEKSFKINPKCPFCNQFYGTPKGDQPKNGKMSHDIINISLPGFPDAKTIVIRYNIPSGNQEAHHPSPGKYYQGINRVAYLPDTKEGLCVLNLLYKAFENGLTFTIGNSVTTGAVGVITWNDIHHKTSIDNSPYGYPDPNYLNRVKEELKAKGIF